jgi:hypothetical protein
MLPTSRQDGTFGLKENPKDVRQQQINKYIYIYRVIQEESAIL